MTATHAVQASQISPEQVAALRVFADDLDPSQLRNLLLALTSHVSAGQDVALFEADGALTPNQVADRLKMSRTHVYKLLDSGELPSHRVGRDRRVRFIDMAEFEARRQDDRRELAERFARATQTREGAIDELLDDL